jgi:hypothetical protein
LQNSVVLVLVAYNIIDKQEYVKTSYLFKPQVQIQIRRLNSFKQANNQKWLFHFGTNWPPG